MSTSSSPPEIDELVRLVGELNRMLSCPYLDENDPVPLAPNQKRTLTFLRRNPGSSLTDLAAELDINLGSSSDLVERLVGMDLVERRTNPDNRRQIQLSLTPGAFEKATRMFNERIAELEHVRDHLSIDEWNSFVVGMRKWVDVMAERYPRKRGCLAPAAEGEQ